MIGKNFQIKNNKRKINNNKKIKIKVYIKIKLNYILMDGIKKMIQNKIYSNKKIDD
jgi:hypothetical protein